MDEPSQNDTTVHWRTSNAANTAARVAAVPQRKPVPTSSTVEKRNAGHQRNRFWARFGRRTWTIIAVFVLAILILVIGLAAGLSTRDRNKLQNLPLPSNNGGPYTGDLTYYGTGLGACGVTSVNGDYIVAVSHLIFDAVQTGSNPNSNPLCGKMIRAKRNDVSVDLKVVDRCTGCQARDLDITEDVFAKLADVNLGRVQVEWSWLEIVPGQASG